jgi:hypothetical protein
LTPTNFCLAGPGKFEKAPDQYPPPQASTGTSITSKLLRLIHDTHNTSIMASVPSPNAVAVPNRAAERVPRPGDDNYLKHFRMVDIFFKENPSVFTRILLIDDPFSNRQSWIQYEGRLMWEPGCMTLQHDSLRPIRERASISEDTCYNAPTRVQGYELYDPFWAILGDRLKAMGPHMRPEITRLSFNFSTYGDDDEVGYDGNETVRLLNLVGVEPVFCNVFYWTQLERYAAWGKRDAIRFVAQVALQSPLVHVVQAPMPLDALEIQYSVNKHAACCSASKEVIATMVSRD